MILGAHVSTSGGIHNAIKNGTDLGVRYDTNFLAKPKPVARKTTHFGDRRKIYHRQWSEVGLGEVIVHDIHLSNHRFHRNTEVLEKSRQAFREQMELAQVLGIRYLVTHLGAHLGEGETFGLKQLSDSFNLLFEKRRGTRCHAPPRNDCWARDKSRLLL